MRSSVAMVLAAALAGGCAAPVEAPVAKSVAGAPLPGPVALRNPGFEADARPGANCATGWACTMHKDPDSFRFFADEAGAAQGARSFCVEPVKKEPWAFITQALFDKSLHGARLRFSIAMRLTDVVGRGAGPWAQVQVPGRPKQTVQKLVTKAQGWETHSVEFEVPANAEFVEVGAMLHGSGRACFDDARLEILRLAKNPV